MLQANSDIMKKTRRLHDFALHYNRIAFFATFQPQWFIIAVSTRLQTNISTDCELVQGELLTRASCFVPIPQGIELCIVCET